MQLIQKYLPNKNLTPGTIKINKSYLANFIDLIRISPNSARILLMLLAYTDRYRLIISKKAIIKKLGISNPDKYLRILLVNAYLDTCEVEEEYYIIKINNSILRKTDIRPQRPDKTLWYDNTLKFNDEGQWLV